MGPSPEHNGDTILDWQKGNSPVALEIRLAKAAGI
jgi:hypothetical protein